ncbi:MAG: T9SS type A sorting domain-containing protein [Chitinophagales bacterium]|nr:T9SS type A sorting domain-containing protein [Chitinophagales bacterium]
MNKWARLIFLFAFFLNGTIAITKAQSGQWIWMKGDTTYNHGWEAGQVGVETANCHPYSAYLAGSWADDSGYFYMLGGLKYAQQRAQYYDNIWRFNTKSNNWMLVRASQYLNSVGIYGIRGVPDTNNYPGSRTGESIWKDHQGTIWLFGGYNQYWGNYNDLWKYDVRKNIWTWVKGPNTTGVYSGNYGIKGLADSANLPPPRMESASWIDENDNLWLFGGYCYCYGDKFYNDLWKYDPLINQWTWMGGTDSLDAVGHAGTKLIPDEANIPSARACTCSWADDTGNFYLYSGTNGILNEYTLGDVWKYTTATGQWTWMNGEQQRSVIGNFGSYCVYDSNNYPTTRNEAVCLKQKDNVYIFSGYVNEANSRAVTGRDLWIYNIPSNQWSRIWGDDSHFEGVYGELGVPDPSNDPRGRMGAVGWMDINNNLWFYGGNWGVYSFTEADLWEYIPDTTCISTGISTMKIDQNIKFYPNPATDQLHIEASSIHNATVTISNLLGQVVLQQQFSDNASIDISTLPKGIYLVNIMDERGNVLQKGKVVKE